MGSTDNHLGLNIMRSSSISRQCMLCLAANCIAFKDVANGGAIRNCVEKFVIQWSNVNFLSLLESAMYHGLIMD